MQTLLQCPYCPHAQSHASTSVCTLKIRTLAAIPLFGHTEILHTPIGMGSAALAAAVPYHATRIPGRDKEVFFLNCRREITQAGCHIYSGRRIITADCHVHKRPHFTVQPSSVLLVFRPRFTSWKEERRKTRREKKKKREREKKEKRQENKKG